MPFNYPDMVNRLNNDGTNKPQSWVDYIPDLLAELAPTGKKGPQTNLGALETSLNAVSPYNLLFSAGSQVYHALTDLPRETERTGRMPTAPEALGYATNAIGMGMPFAKTGALGSAGGKLTQPWFSKVERSASSLPFKSGQGEQILGWLRNQPGVKLEELDWMGLPEWLKEQKGPVTKEQLSDFISNNKVDVQEVVKGNAVSNFPPESDQPIRNAKPKFGPDTHPTMSLPEGENYRELLLTLPTKQESPIPFEQWVKKEGYSPDQLQDPERMAAARRGYESLVSRGKAGQDVNTFTHGHFPEPNVLAHVRFNDRVDAQGKKTLFLEEIQSDWHQKGRKEGYQLKASPADRPDEWVARPHPDRERHNMPDAWLVQPPGSLGAIGVKGANEQEAVANAIRLYGEHAQKPGGVPDAPFKSSWPELSLKRMIKWAADNGYDQIAWTPGKVQAARYDLSKHIDKIAANKTYDGDYHLMIYPKGESSPLSRRLPEKDLADTVGKEMADKIIADAKEPLKPKTYSNLDLQVGGEGMIGFYDKILVNTANKLGKKYGAKVGVTKVHTDPKTWNPYPNDPELAKGVREGSAQEVWSLPITDEMRKSVKGGQPLFTGGVPTGPVDYNDMVNQLQAPRA